MFLLEKGGLVMTPIQSIVVSYLCCLAAAVAATWTLVGLIFLKKAQTLGFVVSTVLVLVGSNLAILTMPLASQLPYQGLPEAPEMVFWCTLVLSLVALPIGWWKRKNGVSYPDSSTEEEVDGNND